MIGVEVSAGSERETLKWRELCKDFSGKEV
jgi:hypothetical protein